MLIFLKPDHRVLFPLHEVAETSQTLLVETMTSLKSLIRTLSYNLSRVWNIRLVSSQIPRAQSCQSPSNIGSTPCRWGPGVKKKNKYWFR